MNNKAKIFSVVLVVLVVSMFGYAYYKSNTLQTNQTNEPASEMPSSSRYSDITRIDAKHFYIDGVHTLAGEVSMPTPCDLLTTDAIVAESLPEQITVFFNVLNNSENCVQTVTPQRFKVSATASEAATFTALFNDRAIELNLIPAAPGETPDEFELFIKG
jgi:hypothetical protein